METYTRSGDVYFIMCQNRFIRSGVIKNLKTVFFDITFTNVFIIVLKYCNRSKRVSLFDLLQYFQIQKLCQMQLIILKSDQRFNIYSFLKTKIKLSSINLCQTIKITNDCLIDDDDVLQTIKTTFDSINKSIDFLISSSFLLKKLLLGFINNKNAHI